MYYLYADDFGLSASKTEAIDEALRNRWVQGASLVVNTDNLHDAIHLAQSHGYQDRISFHLNLTRGFPLTEAVKKTALCKKNGSFAVLKNMAIQRRCMSVRAIQAIRKECEAQMRLFRASGFTSQHIDSHRWCLWNLPVWFAIRPLLKRYGFVTTRTMHGHLLDSSSKEVRMYYRAISLLIRLVLKKKTDWSGCMSEYQEAVNTQKNLRGTYAEIYVHPEYLEGAFIDIFYSYHEKRPLEEVIEIASGFGSPVDFQ